MFFHSEKGIEKYINTFFVKKPNVEGAKENGFNINAKQQIAILMYYQNLTQFYS